jgi:hypothetical protein
MSPFLACANGRGHRLWDYDVTLQKYFSHLSLVIWFFPTPPLKLKLGPQISNYLANQQQLLAFDVPFTSLSIMWKNAEPN